MGITCNFSAKKRELCWMFLLWKGTWSCTKAKPQSCGRIWAMPQLSGSRSANPAPGMCTLRQISKSCTSSRTHHRESSCFPTQQEQLWQGEPKNLLKAWQHPNPCGPPRAAAPLWHWDTLDPESRVWRNKLNSCSGGTSAVMQEFEQTAPDRALKPSTASHQPVTSCYGGHSFCQGWQACGNLIFTLLAILIPPERMASQTQLGSVHSHHKLQPANPLEMKSWTPRKTIRSIKKFYFPKKPAEGTERLQWKPCALSLPGWNEPRGSEMLLVPALGQAGTSPCGRCLCQK